MTSNYNDILKQGYVRLRGRKVGFFKKKWLVLRKASSTGPCRMEKYADETSAKYGVNKKELPLDEVCEVMRVPEDLRKSTFATIDANSIPRQFIVDSDLEADDWVTSFRKVLLMENFTTGNEPDVVTSGFHLNMKNLYHVSLLPSTKLDFHGECLMQISNESIHLFDADDINNRLVTWPLCALRRYGKDSGKFTFETGRGCDTGEGLFGVSSKDCTKIYNQVNDNAHAIAIHKKEAALQRLQSSPQLVNRPLTRDRPSPSQHSNESYYYGEPPVLDLASERKPSRPLRPLPPVPKDDDD